jgi:mono/diheme cytochrome c family protein
MKTKNRITAIYKWGIGLCFATTVVACGPELSPGVEYMPDMYRSPSIEPYVDNAEYGYPDSLSARKPVEGTIPRGSYRPYPYANNDTGYTLAGEQLLNPIALNETVLEEGKELYGYFCQHCHGKKGDGQGTITHAVYSAVPSYADATANRRGGRSMKQLKAGHIYHTIMHGLNAMGSHASQINTEERWKIVHYVQSLQGNEAVSAENTAMTADSTASE